MRRKLNTTAENTAVIHSVKDVLNLVTNQLSLRSFALFRMPGEINRYRLLASAEDPETGSLPPLEELGAGFLISTFSGTPYFIRPDISWDSSTGGFEGKLSAEIQDLGAITKNFSYPTYHLSDFASAEATSNQEEAEYLQLVQKAIHFIKKGSAFKIVPARRKQLQMDLSGRIHEIFENLCEAYPNAFVSVISTGPTGTWVGASPELLVSTQEDIFRTTAVAGTQPYKNQELHTIAWTQKEIEEQALVSRYIINCFKKIRLRDFEEDGPKSVVAGNLVHLRTDFEVNMKETGFPELGSVMLQLLHPTSAVCGMPLEESKSFLNQHEGFDRKLFSGYLGPVNQTEGSHLFVNIRCMEAGESQVTLYAGAGVTRYSDPEKELMETEHKTATLKNIINKL